MKRSTRPSRSWRTGHDPHRGAAVVFVMSFGPARPLRSRHEPVDLTVGIGSAAFRQRSDPPNVGWTLGERGLFFRSGAWPRLQPPSHSLVASTPGNWPRWAGPSVGGYPHSVDCGDGAARTESRDDELKALERNYDPDKFPALLTRVSIQRPSSPAPDTRSPAGKSALPRRVPPCLG